MSECIDQTYGEYYQQKISEFIEKHKLEIMIAGCAYGSIPIADIGLNVFNNRYIVVPYIILISILYVLARLEQNAKERISTN